MKNVKFGETVTEETIGRSMRYLERHLANDRDAPRLSTAQWNDNLLNTCAGVKP